MVITGFGDIIAERMRAEHTNLAARWLERLVAILPVDAPDVFPSPSLLDHIPALIVDLSEYLQTPEEGVLATNTAVVEKARQLGALRHDQRASLHQVLREYQLLGGILVSFVQEETLRLALTPPVEESMVVISRLHLATNTLMQETVETFVRLYTKTIENQAQRLEEFTRMATHEWRQPLGSLQFAVSLLRQAEMDPARAARTLDVMDRSLSHLVEVTKKIEEVARLHGEPDNPIMQEVSLSMVAAEAARQLRDVAQAHHVEIRVTENLPVLTVDVGRLELALLNLLSNGIKYADAQKAQRFIDVLEDPQGPETCGLVVRDNGIGIPSESLQRIFHRFSRGHTDRETGVSVPGLGLGLSIVADCIRAMDGTIDVQSQEGVGTTFSITLPRKQPAQRARP